MMTPSGINLSPGMDTAVKVHVLRFDGFTGEIELEFDNQPLFWDPTKKLSIDGGKVPAGKDVMNFTIRAPAIKMPKICKLSIIGKSRINGREIKRKVQGADNIMQAFLWRHLVAASEMIAVINNRRFMVSPRLLNETPVHIPPGGNVEIKYAVKKLYAKRDRISSLKLIDPPEGLKLSSYNITPAGVNLTLDYNGEEALSDNVVVEVLIKRGKKGNFLVSGGFLPCIPLKIGCTKENNM
ncbi:hypothetical protein ACFL35_19550, partial [Candidatus Riflebacteria bacterium]